MEKRSKRASDSYFCTFCGGQVQKRSKKSHLQESAKDTNDDLGDWDEDDLNNYTSTKKT